MTDRRASEREQPTVVIGPRKRSTEELGPPRDELLPGSLLGPYRLGLELARGGMSTVYFAEHVLLERPVAIKVAHAYDDELGRLHERFHREAKFLATLDHPGVVRVHDFGYVEDGRPWLAMELLHGATLGEIMAREAIDMPRTLRTLRGIAQALAAAHHASVVHRDLKPDNVFVTSTERIKVLDWGTAFVRPRGSEHSRFTLGRLMIGTPAYIAPEQARGLAVDGRADVYSLGIVAYEMIAHRVPFDGPTDVSIALQHATAAPPPLADAWPELPARLEALVMRMLEKRPAQRPDIDEVDAELARIAVVVGATVAT